MKYLAIILATTALLLTPVLSETPLPNHILVGCWQGSDSTVIIFRNDHTFVGRDYLGRRIWGSWSVLNDKQIGFQALYHSGSYAPEYAEITPTGMRYACPDNDGFIGCKPIDFDTAAKLVDSATLNQKRGD